MSLRYGYVTNGLTGRRLDDALRMLADCGYDGVALTLDFPRLDSYVPLSVRRARRLGELLDALGLARVVEIGARISLDPRRKPFPGFLDEGREQRIEMVRRAIDAAAGLGADVVSFWPGPASGDLYSSIAWQRMQDSCERVLAHAERRDVTLGLEPERGLLGERVADFEALWLRLGRPRRLGLTLDLGHAVCAEPEWIPRIADRLVHVRVEDMRRGLNAGPALTSLRESGYRGLVAIELSRHAHDPHETVPQALAHLRAREREQAGEHVRAA